MSRMLSTLRLGAIGTEEFVSRLNHPLHMPEDDRQVSFHGIMPEKRCEGFRGVGIVEKDTLGVERQRRRFGAFPRRRSAGRRKGCVIDVDFA